MRLFHDSHNNLLRSHQAISTFLIHPKPRRHRDRSTQMSMEAGCLRCARHALWE
ncbi:hypothetical protein CJF32_00000938 [Rutstroemia sp. NJR-2017a WRK4]|nr:hypothetical protein CJF32_00000938 [Rutstroemia sp. NJR-2017a WRK4]